MSVNPKVIETPVVAAIAKDGIELRAKARVTVRANIDRLVGGAGEQTIIARVGEGVVTTVGSATDHKQVLENPDAISKTVLSKVLMQVPLLKFFPLILQTLTWEEMSVPSCRQTRRKRINVLPRQKLKKEELWLLQGNRK